jgi:hypothetical protein
MLVNLGHQVVRFVRPTPGGGTNMCLCEKSHDIVADPDNTHSPVAPNLEPAIDHHESEPRMEISRLDALDHVDVLSNCSGRGIPHGRYCELNRLEMVFDAAARLLAREDHSRQTLNLHISRRAIEILVRAHCARSESMEDKHIESLHRDHAARLQQHLAGPVSSGEPSCWTDA